MPSNNPDGNATTRTKHDNVDRNRYEHEVADVVDLDAERERRGATRDDNTEQNDDNDGGPVLVDSTEAQRPARFTVAGARNGRRRPIVPGWLRSRTELAATVRWAAGHLAHTMAYHLTRTPKYAGKLALRAPRGLFRTVGGFGRWLFDLEGERVRQATVRTGDAEAYLKLVGCCGSSPTPHKAAPASLRRFSPNKSEPDHMVGLRLFRS